MAADSDLRLGASGDLHRLRLRRLELLGGFPQRLQLPLAAHLGVARHLAGDGRDPRVEVGDVGRHRRRRLRRRTHLHAQAGVVRVRHRRRRRRAARRLGARRLARRGQARRRGAAALALLGHLDHSAGELAAGGGVARVHARHERLQAERLVADALHLPDHRLLRRLDQRRRHRARVAPAAAQQRRLRRCLHAVHLRRQLGAGAGQTRVHLRGELLQRARLRPQLRARR
eukprot:514953-Prorocentrum_minimum.AAC.1